MGPCRMSPRRPILVDLPPLSEEATEARSKFASTLLAVAQSNCWRLRWRRRGNQKGKRALQVIHSIMGPLFHYFALDSRG